MAGLDRFGCDFDLVRPEVGKVGYAFGRIWADVYRTRTDIGLTSTGYGPSLLAFAPGLRPRQFRRSHQSISICWANSAAATQSFSERVLTDWAVDVDAGAPPMASLKLLQSKLRQNAGAHGRSRFSASGLDPEIGGHRGDAAPPESDIGASGDLPDDGDRRRRANAIHRGRPCSGGTCGDQALGRPHATKVAKTRPMRVGSERSSWHGVPHLTWRSSALENGHGDTRWIPCV